MTTTAKIVRTSALGARILSEGYGPGAWHGPDLKAALADVTPETAFRRPAEGRHNIAEIALHHAYCVRAVRKEISGVEPGTFILEGGDWFTLDQAEPLTWARVQSVVDEEQRRLTDLIAAVEEGREKSPLAEADRFSLVLGATCHAVYHAGQVQLVKRLIQ